MACIYLKYAIVLACNCINFLYERMANINAQDIATPLSKIIGGGTSNIFTTEELQPFINKSNTAENFKFVNYLTLIEATELQDSNPTFVAAYVSWAILLPKLTIAELKAIA